MGVDAYIEEDSAICRGFAVLASALDGVHSMGADGFFASVASRVAGHPASPAVAKLEARASKLEGIIKSALSELGGLKRDIAALR